MGPCSALHYTIWGHAVHCIIPYGAISPAGQVGRSPSPSSSSHIALCHMGPCSALHYTICGHAVHCIIPYGAMQCIASYHMGACGALHYTIWGHVTCWTGWKITFSLLLVSYCIMPYGGMQCIALYHMGPCSALHYTIWGQGRSRSAANCMWYWDDLQRSRWR